MHRIYVFNYDKTIKSVALITITPCPLLSTVLSNFCDTFSYANGEWEMEITLQKRAKT